MKALIDIGSSTVKLSIYKNNKLTHKESVTSKLAEGLYPNLVLQDTSIKNTVDVVQTLVNKAKKMGSEKVKLVSTGAARKAKNSNELVEAVLNKTRLVLQIVSADDEARILYNGVINDFDTGNKKLAVINIGGNSTEIIIGTANLIESKLSLPIGVVALNEEFLLTDPATENEYKQMVSYIQHLLYNPGIIPPKVDLLVHTGGELTYMKTCQYKLDAFSESKSNPKKVTLSNYVKRNQQIRKLSKEELHKFMPENPLWMDGAIACNAVAERIANYVEAHVIIPSNKNLNDGLVLEM